MLKPYSWPTLLRRPLGKLGLLAALLTGAVGTAQAQFSYTVASGATTTSNYVDLGTTGTVIATANTDDASSSAQDIGFSFTYNGTAFTQFVLNTNGLLRLGASAPSTDAADPVYAQTPEAGPINSTNAADVNLLMPFNFDLTAGTSPAEYRVFTTGTAGSRVCTIQWKNVADKAVLSAAGGTLLPTQFTNFAFQVKLYEANNQIDFVYNSATTGTSALKYAIVGLKGSGNAVGQDLLAVKASSAAWSTTTFYTGPQQAATAANAHNFRSTFPPDAGRTYRFTPVAATDAAVSVIYTYGKLATASTLPHAVQAVITNAGFAALTNVVATLSVTGANTFGDTKTVASLAAGASATVTFAAYPTTLAVGANTVTVTVPSDGNNANNTATYGQLVTTNRVSYTDPTVAATGGVGLGNAYFLSKYTLPTAPIITDVVLTLAAVANSNTNSNAPFQVVIYDATGGGGLPGQVLYTSATQNRTAAGGAVTVPVPAIAIPTSFYIGVRETSAASINISYQTETPIRPATFYYSTDGATWNDFINVTPQARVAIEFGTTTVSCAAPTAVVVSGLTATTATVSFTAPSTGTSGYQVVYGPTGFDPSSGGTTVAATTSPVTLTGLTAATSYQVYVRSNCTAGGTSIYTTPVSFTTGCPTSTTVAAAPYTQNFDTLVPGQPLPCGITVLDANADGATWAINRTAPYSGTNAIRYTSALSNSQMANDWFFTPGLTTTAGTRYQVAFRYRGEGIANSPSAYTESLEVKAGPAATAAGQTTALYANAAITNTSYALANGAAAPAVAVWQPGAGTQYLGFHAISAANQGNIYIDDLSISTVLATTSAVLLRAVTVFPNPSTNGLFDLDIHGANAKGSLDVQVVNTLGQRVYTGSARDNYTNRLDLSALAPGIYHLLVRDGDDFVTRQLAIAR